MIIEGLVTCDSPTGPHVSVLGPVVDEDLQSWLLRPFQTSQIFSLLRESKICTFHVIDDVVPIVRLVLGEPSGVTTHRSGDAWIIDQACHWYKLELLEWNLSNQRSEVRARTIAHQVQRPFWGWNRARHALLEAAILVSRAHLVTQAELIASLQPFQLIIDKTAGSRERQAWQWIQERVHSQTPS